MIFLLKGNKIARKKFYLSKIRSTFFHTCDIIPGRLIFCCMYHQTSHFNVKRWIVQGRLSNFQKKISCKNNPLKVKIQRTRESVKWHCSQACFMYLLTCYLYTMQQRISNKILFVCTLFSTNKFRRISTMFLKFEYALLVYNSNLKLYFEIRATIKINEFLFLFMHH